MKNSIIITNNPSVDCGAEDIYLAQASVEEVLLCVRNMTHLGHRLLTHPFAGSVKPNENPYKSVVVTCARFEVDYQSVRIIESCLEMARRMFREKPYSDLPARVLSDLALIDKSILDAGLESLDEQCD